jgi:anionic cell wall polymer biosynthesis LytR-Cps2A-Psr (LCP) family protein
MNKNKLGKVMSLIVILLLVGLAGWQIFVFSGLDNILKLTNSAFDNSNLDFTSLFGGKVEVKGQREGRTNVLLYGINEFDGNGKGTVDTNIILSYFHEQKKISTVSFMRDMIVDGNEKLNAIYPSLANSANQNKEYLKYMTDLTGMNIHYGVKINMKAAQELVDKIGGIEVNVPTKFKDIEYPKFNDYSVKYCEERNTRDPYMCPSQLFEKGLNTLNGEKALIYARSRKGQCYNEKSQKWFDVDCSENGDDARNVRQQVVIQGIAQKIKSDIESKKIIFDLKYLQSIFEVLGTNIQSSMNIAEAFSLIQVIKSEAKIEDMKKVGINYKTTVYKNQQLLLCTSNSSDITLCDGTAFTIKNTGNYALRLRQIIQNPLEEKNIEIVPDTQQIIKR